jgi:hypothetical protein
VPISCCYQKAIRGESDNPDLTEASIQKEGEKKYQWKKGRREETGACFADEAMARTLTLLLRRRWRGP